MVVRRLLHAAGYRYRLHDRQLPGRPDLVFKGRRKIVLVHGCFWHQHQEERCLDGRKPKSNTGYWHEKLERNVERDRRNEAELRALGWDLLVVWECEMRSADELLRRLIEFLGPAINRTRSNPTGRE